MSAGLFFMLLTLAYFIAFTQVTAKPDTVKDILRGSGIYRKVPSVVYDQSVRSNSNSKADIPLKSPIVRSAAMDAFTPEFVQNNIENAIDGVYGWLQGDKSQPEFKIETGSVRKRFADSLSRRVATRLKKLPVCTAGQMQTPSQINPYTAACLPAGTDADAYARDIRQAAGSKKFIKDIDFSPSSLKDPGGNQLVGNASKLPEAYQAALNLPYILAGLALVLGAAVVYVSRTRSDGFKKLSLTLGVAGIFALMIPFGFRTVTDTYLKSASNSTVVTELAGPVLKEFNKNTAKVYYVTGGAYLVLSVAAFYVHMRIEGIDPKSINWKRKADKVKKK